MNHRSGGVAVLVLVCVLVGGSSSGSAFATTTLAYWSTLRADRALVAVNPQFFSASPFFRQTLTVAASCNGVGQYRRTGSGVRLYHFFDCSSLVSYEGNGWLVHLPSSRWCAYTHHGIDEIVRYGRGWVPGCG